jgi:dihydrofolate synthase/folylpolyglutamate synthase
MGYREAMAHLDALGVDAMKHMAPSLKRIKAICAVLDHPERTIPAIHITGTNGKTSTARIATALLGAAGLNVGTYTSPHLESVNERIALNGTPIPDEEFGDLFDHFKPYLDVVESDIGERLTYFEVLTAMFFLWATERPVDAMVVEVGLGGRWDATNVLLAPVAVITNIAFDHTALLGNDRPTIAREKAGIIKPGAQVVTAELSPDALAVIQEEADEVEANVSVIQRDFGASENTLAIGGRYLSLFTSSARYDEMFLPLHGDHQGDNAAMALEAVTRFLPTQIFEEALVAEGFGTTTADGRMETIRLASETGAAVVLDVAHNPDGMSAMVSSLIEAFPFDRVVVVLGILEDKDHLGMLTELARLKAHVIATKPRSARSIDPGELAKVAEALGLSTEVIEDVGSSVRRALSIAEPGELVCITGSHYVVGEARTELRH